MSIDSDSQGAEASAAAIASSMLHFLLGNAELPMLVGQFLGLARASAFSTTARIYLEPFQSALASIAASQPEYFVIIGGMQATSNRRLNTILAFNPKTSAWVAWPPMPTPRSYCAAAVLGGSLFVVGGRNGPGQQVSDALERLDSKTGVWTTLASMPTPRSSCAAIAFKGCLYVIGGRILQFPLGNVQRFDPATNTWTTLGSLLTPRHSCAATVAGGDIWVFGGWGDPSEGLGWESGKLNSVERFHHGSNTWSSMPPMPVRLGNCTVGAQGSKVYVAGTTFSFELSPFKSQQCLLVYDMGSGGWKTYVSTNLLSCGGHCAGALIGSSLYLANRKTPSSRNEEILRVNVSQGSWDWVSMPSKRTDWAAVAVRSAPPALPPVEVLTAADLESKSLKQLRQLCEEREIGVTGSKAVLKARLLEYDPKLYQ